MLDLSLKHVELFQSEVKELAVLSISSYKPVGINGYVEHEDDRKD